jgi:hypothetical protein
MLVGVRFVFGTASWFAPKLTLRLLGMNPDTNPEAAYVSRLFGMRDAALGAGLISTKGDARRLWWKIGIACDLADVAAGVVSARSGQLPKNVFVRAILIGAGVVGASLGGAALAGGDL